MLFLKRAAAAISILAIAGCAAVDATLAPRTDSVNAGANDVFNNAILLNIVRSSKSEPLNFVGLAKYTAASQLSLQTNIVTSAYAAAAAVPANTFGPNNAGGQVQNSFDLSSLETKDFYTALLRAVDGNGLSIWFHTDVPSKLAWYIINNAIEVETLEGHAFSFTNDPSDDTWTEGGVSEARSERCIALAGTIESRDRPGNDGFQPPFGRNAVWNGSHADDCVFHKFDYFVRLAVKYGLMFENVTASNPKAAKDTPTEPKTLSKTQTCFDPAIARRNQAILPPSARLCGSGKTAPEGRDLVVDGLPAVRAIRFKIRSPYRIFEYLGRIVDRGDADRVPLETPGATSGEGPADRIVDIGPPTGAPCFAEAALYGRVYCVPADGARNTKRIFAILRALLAINTAVTDLSPTPTVRLTP